MPFLLGDPRPHLTHGSFSRLRPHPKPNFDSCNHNDRPQPLLWRILQTAQYDCDCMSRLGSSHWSCCTECIAVLYSLSTFVFSALTLLVGRQEEHPACKNWVTRCWCGYLSGVRCRLFAYGPANATVVPKPRYLLPHLNPDWFYLSGTGSPRLSWKEAVKWV